VTTSDVTHDHVEAISIGTRVAVRREGVLLKHGPPRQFYDDRGRRLRRHPSARPGNPLCTRIERDAAALACMLDDRRLSAAAGRGSVAALAASTGRELIVDLRSEHLREPAGSNAPASEAGRA
jgi:ABC-type sugar transport system ATPase subunit